MATTDNTGLGLIKTTIERVQNEKSLFGSALKKLVNSSEEELDDFLKKVITPKAVKGILRPISVGKTLTLKALDGRRLIYKAGKTFKSFIDSDFVNWSLNKPGALTSEIQVRVDEMVKNGTFMDIFLSLPGLWYQKCLSQNQVIEFCETLPEWLKKEEYATIFLVRKDESKLVDENNPSDNLVVVFVGVYSDGLDVGVNRLEDDNVLNGQYRYRVVSPQL